MGCASSKQDDDASRASQSIDDEIKRSKKELSKTIKTLMLGPGESGKSTVVKQLRLTYSRSWNDDERRHFKEVIFANTLQSMQVTLQGFEVVHVDFPFDLDDAARLIVDAELEDIVDVSTGDLEKSTSRALKALWASPATKAVVEQSSRFQLNDSAAYFFDSIDRIAREGYLPTDEDILRARVRSTGIVEETFQVGGTKMVVVDVGGQRSERKKWIHCFENVQLLIFVAAISEFDQVLYEDSSRPRLDESLLLWESIATSPWFSRTAMILFLNKTDLLERKVKANPQAVRRFLPDYAGSPFDVDSIKAYFISRFQRLNRNRERALFTHLTCATDTTSMRTVLRGLMESVITSALSEGGFL
ncbi:hypothetical protein JCM10212_006433 [Sporobolomyces blumeae]